MSQIAPAPTDSKRTFSHMQQPIAGITSRAMKTNPTQTTKDMKKKHNNPSSKSRKCHLLSLKPRSSLRKRKRISCPLMQRKSSEVGSLQIWRPSRVVSRRKNWRKRSSTSIPSRILSALATKMIQIAKKNNSKLKKKRTFLLRNLKSLKNLQKRRRNLKNPRNSKRRKSWKLCWNS